MNKDLKIGQRVITTAGDEYHGTITDNDLDKGASNWVWVKWDDSFFDDGFEPFWGDDNDLVPVEANEFASASIDDVQVQRLSTGVLQVDLGVHGYSLSAECELDLLQIAILLKWAYDCGVEDTKPYGK